MVVKQFFITVYKLMTFTIKSNFDRWFEIASGILVWLNLFVIVYAILKGLGLM